MQRTDKAAPRATARGKLGRHLALALILKLIVLVLLWLTFVKPHRIQVDVPTMADHMTGTPATLKETHHD